ADDLLNYPLRIHSLTEQPASADSLATHSSGAIVTHYDDVASLRVAWRKHQLEPGIILFKGPDTDQTGIS
ncbi:hypothetical protein, partial [Spirosoma sordidisoli]|uniref:hypothetical protein n=1 Tax=Spirosoma sordidisoli TaxID=2502893 RepID=UPI0019D2DF27